MLSALHRQISNGLVKQDDIVHCIRTRIAASYILIGDPIYTWETISSVSLRFLALGRNEHPPPCMKLKWTAHDSSEVYLLQGPQTCPVEDRYYLRSRLVRSRVPLPLIRFWIQECRRKHFDNKQTDAVFEEPRPSQEPVIDLRLIDVQNREIVLGSSSWRYLTLSYVLGTTNSLTLSRKNYGQLHEEYGLDTVQIPHTIGDAITLSASIGERYLWVDSMCIQQDDEHDKAKFRACMDIIFENSALTLVDATTNTIGTDRGLPGVSPNTRTGFQDVHAVSGTELVVSHQLPFWGSLRQSTWSTRGWTLQEGLLADKLLFFTYNFCYFSCARYCCFGEDFNLEDDGTGSQLDNSAQLEKLNVPSNIVSVLNILERYADRHMTKPDDIFIGLEGLMKRCRDITTDEGVPPRTEFLDGMPLVVFDFTLCWQEDSHDPSRRRAGFPSWSWAGWTHRIKFREVPQLSRLTAGRRRLSYQCLFFNRLLLTPGQLVQPFWEDLTLKEHFGRIVSPTYSDIGSDWDVVPPQVVYQSALVFRTSHAILEVGARIGEHPSREGSRVQTTISQDAEFELLCPGTSHKVASVWLHQVWWDTMPLSLCLDFIVVKAFTNRSLQGHKSYRVPRTAQDIRNEKPNKEKEEWELSIMCVN